jgi:hypothetical protein
MPSNVIDMNVPVSSRGDATLELSAPSGNTAGVLLELYIRMEKGNTRKPVGPTPRDYIGPVTVSIPQSELTTHVAVGVEANVVVKQPATFMGSLKIKGKLTIGGQSAEAEESISLNAGETGTMGSLTWWIEQ